MTTTEHSVSAAVTNGGGAEENRDTPPAPREGRSDTKGKTDNGDKPPPITRENLRDESWKDIRGLLGLVSAVPVVGLVAIGVYAAAAAEERGELLAGGVAIATASLTIGAFFGFLFALPRVRRGEQGEQGQDVRSNFNLEDISDWLTKIIVGISLTQIGRIPEGAGALSETMSTVFGDAPGSGIFGVALALTFAVSGFLLGYLTTRTYVAAVMIRSAEWSLTQALVDRVETAVKKGNTAEESARALAGQVRAVESRVEETERALGYIPPGDARRREADNRAMAATRQAETTPPSESDIQQAFQDGKTIEGLAMMPYAKHPEAHLDLLVQELHAQNSEEFRIALKAAAQLTSHCSASAQKRIVEAVMTQEQVHLKGKAEFQALADAVYKAADHPKPNKGGGPYEARYWE